MVNHKTRWKADSPPNLLLAIDPGAHWGSNGPPYAGVAMFQWGKLCFGQLVKAPSTVSTYAWPSQLPRRICKEAGIPQFDDLAGRVDKNGDRIGGELLTVLAVEKPIIYAKGEAPPSDIMDVREIYGACMAAIEAEHYYGPQPGEWKADVEKRIMNERVLTFLDAGERSVLINSEANGTAGMSDHVIDAVGIGLFTLGRMARGGI